MVRKSKSGDQVDPVHSATLDLPAQLQSISVQLAGAAQHAAATALRLSAMAHNKLSEIDDVAPLTDDGLESLKGIAALTKLAGESSKIGFDLLRANKDVPVTEDSPTPVAIVFGVVDASHNKKERTKYGDDTA